MKNIIFFLFILSVVSLYSQDINDKEQISVLPSILSGNNFDYDEIKRQNVVFNAGAYLNTKNNFLMGENGEYITTPFSFAPKTGWLSENSATIWGSIVFEEGNYIQMSIDGTFLFKDELILPVFNISELYISWKYPLGKIIIGRTIYSLNSFFNFSGTLDGLGIEINAPFINFKSFLGFSGFTGIFHPHYNDFNISSFDKSYVEQTNLKNLVMVIQLNGIQSRRLFLSTDFDINYMFFNVNPYFLMQLDISNIDAPNFKNNEYTFNTFTVGLLNKFRIWTPLYFYFDVSGVFGSLQDFANSKNIPISAFAVNTELRYTFAANSKTSISIGYATGSGTELETTKDGPLTTNTSKLNNYIYYGNFDGGYVLSPLLYNIHSVSIKFISNINSLLSCYIYGFQTFKMHSESPISDEKANKNDFLVGTEVDAGLSISILDSVKLNFDAGVFIPLTAYTDTTPRVKAGLSLSITL